jgi:hypothetical protein
LNYALVEPPALVRLADGRDGFTWVERVGADAAVVGLEKSTDLETFEPDTAVEIVDSEMVADGERRLTIVPLEGGGQMIYFRLSVGLRAP